MTAKDWRELALVLSAMTALFVLGYWWFPPPAGAP